MTSFKDVTELDKTPASIGGAMGTWPFRTLWYLCRWERTGQTDPAVIEHLQEENLDGLRELAVHAGREGFDTSTLDKRIHALEDSDPQDMREALSKAYDDHYTGAGMRCPYEKEGSDMACHRCPVVGDAIKYLEQ